ncbi:MAG: hypothetical protein RLZ69_512 [Actinomycetota bacterium]|jgi:raffinose/stachyose/melibiose transport system permease protein
MFRYTKLSFLREILVWLAAAVIMSPIYLLVNVALKGDEAFGEPALLPARHPSLNSFFHVFNNPHTASLSTGMFNSALITVVAVTGLVMLASVTAYVLNRRLSKVSRTVYYMILVGIVVPSQLGLVPLYVGARALGLLGSPLGMAIIYIAMLMPLAVFLYGGFVRSLAPEYEEAAFIDGASRFRAFTQVVFPLLSPATGTVAIMTGLIIWNDFFTPLIFLNGSDNPTVPLVIFSYVGSSFTNWSEIFAILILALIPITALYLVFQRKFIQGFAGGIKS